MWTELFVASLVVPVLILVLGVCFKNNSPKNINRMVGYRTRMSMKNQDTWDYANKKLGQLWVTAGAAMLVAAVILMLLVKDAASDIVMRTGIVSIVVEVIILIITAIAVENSLKKNFDSDGNKK